MCDCTHHEASIASTNTPARDLSADSSGHNQANAGGNSCPNETLNGSQSKKSSLVYDFLEEYANSNPGCVAKQFVPGMDTSHDFMQFMHVNAEESGLLINEEVLSFSGFRPGDEVSIALFNGTAVITTDHQKKALIRAAQELQLRQDELKESFSDGIALLIKTLCNGLVNNGSPNV